MGSFVVGVGVGVLATLLSAAIIGTFNYVRDEANRKRLRQRLCRHDWENVDKLETNPETGFLVFVRGYTQRCRKCSATR
jgi:hypothetical protein